MGPTEREQHTFYDEHPFDWVLPDQSAPMRSVVARAPYFFVHFVRSKGQRTWQGARNLFYDYFVTPYVAFVPSATVEGWCAKHAVHVMRYDENRGANVHSFCIVKERPQETRNPSNSPAEAVLSD